MLEIDPCSVELLVDMETVQSPSAFSMREHRVKPSGMFETFLEFPHPQAAARLVPLFRQRNKPVPVELEREFAVYSNLIRQLLERGEGRSRREPCRR